MTYMLCHTLKHFQHVLLKHSTLPLYSSPSSKGFIYIFPYNTSTKIIFPFLDLIE